MISWRLMGCSRLLGRGGRGGVEGGVQAAFGICLHDHRRSQGIHSRSSWRLAFIHGFLLFCVFCISNITFILTFSLRPIPMLCVESKELVLSQLRGVCCVRTMESQVKEVHCVSGRISVSSQQCVVCEVKGVLGLPDGLHLFTYFFYFVCFVFLIFLLFLFLLLFSCCVSGRRRFCVKGVSSKDYLVRDRYKIKEKSGQKNRLCVISKASHVRRVRCVSGQRKITVYQLKKRVKLVLSMKLVLNQVKGVRFILSQRN